MSADVATRVTFEPIKPLIGSVVRTAERADLFERVGVRDEPVPGNTPVTGL